MDFFRRHFARAPREPLPACLQNYLDAPRPDDDLYWRNIPYTVLDVETSGLNPRHDSLLAAGLINIEKGRIRMDSRWYTLIRPPEETLVKAESIRIHGILRSDLKEAPLPDDILLELLTRLTGRVMIVHVSSIDVQFLDRALQKYFGIRLRGPVFDTARFAGALMHNDLFTMGGHHHDAPRDTTLRGLTKKANLPLHSQHNALSDALMTAQLFLSQMTRFEKQGTTTFRKLFRAGGSLK